MSYHSGRVAVVDLETRHGFNDGHDGLDSIAINHRSVLLALVLRVAVFVNDPGKSIYECFLSSLPSGNLSQSHFQPFPDFFAF